MFTNVILCGGNGARLWPISRSNLPKQFLTMFDDKSLFQLTCKRNSNYCDNSVVVSNEQQYFLAANQLYEIDDDFNLDDFSSIIEPIGKNTAPAVAFSAFSVNSETILFVTPSDHLVKNNKNYESMILRAKELAEAGYLVTFGIKPTQAETGYGYIKANGENVESFHEKPSLEQAKEYLKSKNYFWNSGMFCFKASTYLEELKRYSPEIYNTSLEAFKNAKKGEFIRIQKKDMLKIPKNSIDYAVMEKSSKIKMVFADLDWKDICSFDELDNVFEKDIDGNTKHDQLVTIDSKNNFVFGKYKTIALDNVEDLIIVDTPSALLVSKKGKSQNVKDVVKILKKKNPEIIKFGRTVYKPWGKFTNLEEGARFRVKIMFVNPGKRLSLQKHLHRSEHWTVVEGTATVEVNEKIFLVRPNESTYISIGSIHRLSNEGKLPVKIIEVQVGEYLGEDDIVRFKDDFGRIQ